MFGALLLRATAGVSAPAIASARSSVDAAAPVAFFRARSESCFFQMILFDMSPEKDFFFLKKFSSFPSSNPLLGFSFFR